MGVLFEDSAFHQARIERSFLTASCVLVTMTSLAVWATGLPKLLCALIGILVGYAAAALLGVFPEEFGSQLSSSPFFALPDPSFLSLSVRAFTDNPPLPSRALPQVCASSAS